MCFLCQPALRLRPLPPGSALPHRPAPAASASCYNAPPPSLHALQAYTRCLAYDPEGTYLASVNADGTLNVWEIDSKRQLLRKKACPKVTDTAPRLLITLPAGT